MYIGKETMRNIHEKKYLGDIIFHNMNNYSNIKEKPNRAVGIVNELLTSLLERPYGRFTFRAAKIMSESMLVGSLLNNSESWINLNKTNMKNLEKTDTIPQKEILKTKENPSKAFMYLELGILPVKYVVMRKSLNLLKYILN